MVSCVPFLSCSLGREANYFYSFRKSYWPGPGFGGFLKNLTVETETTKLLQGASKLKLENKTSGKI